MGKAYGHDKAIDEFAILTVQDLDEKNKRS